MGFFKNTGIEKEVNRALYIEDVVQTYINAWRHHINNQKDLPPRVMVPLTTFTGELELNDISKKPIPSYRTLYLVGSYNRYKKLKSDLSQGKIHAYQLEMGNDILNIMANNPDDYVKYNIELVTRAMDKYHGTLFIRNIHVQGLSYPIDVRYTITDDGERICEPCNG